MDDASPPSLLSLPCIGFVERSNGIYQATRRMVLSRSGYPYYIVGKELEGKGSPTYQSQDYVADRDSHTDLD